VLVLLAKFNLAMAAAQILLANFVRPKLHKWKCVHKIKGVSTVKTSKFICTTVENAEVRTHKFREILTLVL